MAVRTINTRKKARNDQAHPQRGHQRRPLRRSQPPDRPLALRAHPRLARLRRARLRANSRQPRRRQGAAGAQGAEIPQLRQAAKAWRADPAKMALLENTKSPNEIDSADYDAIYFTGGHAVMYDFPDSDGLQRITREIYERGDIVSSVCHGYCGLLNTKLSDGSYLIAGKKMTGFAKSSLASTNSSPSTRRNGPGSAARYTRKPCFLSSPTPSSMPTSSPGKIRDRPRRQRKRSLRFSNNPLPITRCYRSANRP